MSDDRGALLAEAYKRGILPPEQKSAYEEAQKRGLVGAASPSPPLVGGGELPSPEQPRKPFSQPMPSATAALPSVLEGVVEGVTDIPTKVTQGITHALPFKSLQESEDKFVKERETRIAAEQGKPGRGGVDIPRTIGNVIGTAPLAAVTPAGTAGAAAAGMASGGLSRPVVDGKNFWWETGKDVLAGAAGGAAGRAVTTGAGSVLAPQFNAAKDLLMREGVRLTPGQMSRGASRAGDMLNRGEGALGSVPLVGSEVRHAEADSIATFNRAAWNRALQPIGMQLPNDIEMGRPAAQYVSDQMQAAYNRIYPMITVRPDPAFANEIRTILQRARAALPDPQYTQFERLIQEQSQKLGAGGRTPGVVAKGIDSELGRHASDRYSDPSVDVRALGGFFQDVQTAWRDVMMRSAPPDIRVEMQAANHAYANYVRLMRASAATGSPNGVFTPAKLASAVRADDPTLRKMSTARGTALLQDLSDAGVAVLPNTVRDSGTPERALWFGLLSGGAGVSPGTAAALGAATLPYTTPGRAALNAWARPGPTRDAAARQLEGLEPFAASTGGTTANDAINGRQ